MASPGRPKRERRLDAAENVPLLRAAVGGKLRARRQGGDAWLLMLPLGPSNGLGEVFPESLTNGRPFSVPEHVDHVNVKRYYNGSIAPVAARCSMVARQCTNASHAPGTPAPHWCMAASFGRRAGMACLRHCLA